MLQIAGRAAPQIAESETSSSQTPPRSDSQSFSLPPKLLEMTYEQLGQLDDENLERLGLYEAVINRMNELEGK